MAFKRIAKEPLPVSPTQKVLAAKGIKLPTQTQIDGMSPEEAYNAGKKLAEHLQKAATYILPGGILGTNAVPYYTGNVVNTTSASPNASFVYAPKTASQTLVGPSGSGTTPVSDITLLFKESDTGIGFKQWSVWIENTTVITEWGHCDKTKQLNRVPFNSLARAEEYRNSCIAAKLKKGYRRTK